MAPRRSSAFHIARRTAVHMACVARGKRVGNVRYFPSEKAARTCIDTLNRTGLVRDAEAVGYNAGWAVEWNNGSAALRGFGGRLTETAIRKMHKAVQSAERGQDHVEWQRASRASGLGPDEFLRKLRARRAKYGAFAGTREEHKKRAPWDAAEARRKLADARSAIARENCRSAYADMLDAFFFMGKAMAHKGEYRAGVHQTARHRRQDSKYGLRLLKLKRRFRDACVVKAGG